MMDSLRRQIGKGKGTLGLLTRCASQCLSYSYTFYTILQDCPVVSTILFFENARNYVENPLLSHFEIGLGDLSQLLKPITIDLSQLQLT